MRKINLDTPPAPNYLPLWQAIKDLGLPPGDIIEFGSLFGATARQLASLWPDRRVWALDTFEGTPYEDHTSKYDSAHIQAGSLTFSDQSKIATLFVQHANISPLQGRFVRTLPVIPNGTAIALAYIDCNLYASSRQACKWLADHLVDGAWIVVDDYAGFTGVRKAVDEFLDELGLSPHDVWDGKSNHLCMSLSTTD